MTKTATYGSFFEEDLNQLIRARARQRLLFGSDGVLPALGSGALERGEALVLPRIEERGSDGLSPRRASDARSGITTARS